MKRIKAMAWSLTKLARQASVLLVCFVAGMLLTPKEGQVKFVVKEAPKLEKIEGLGALERIPGLDVLEAEIQKKTNENEARDKRAKLSFAELWLGSQEEMIGKMDAFFAKHPSLLDSVPAGWKEEYFRLWKEGGYERAVCKVNRALERSLEQQTHHDVAVVRGLLILGRPRTACEEASRLEKIIAPITTELGRELGEEAERNLREQPTAADDGK